MNNEPELFEDFPHENEDCDGTVHLENPQIQDSEIVYRANCPQCGKEMWGIARVDFEGFQERI